MQFLMRCDVPWRGSVGSLAKPRSLVCANAKVQHWAAGKFGTHDSVIWSKPFAVIGDHGSNAPKRAKSRSCRMTSNLGRKAVQ
jgi:hypothetical protein